MKPTEENFAAWWNDGYEDLERAYRKTKLYEMQHGVFLPENIPGFFDDIEEKATGLPEKFAEFERGLKTHVGLGRHALKNDDDFQLRVSIWIIYQSLPLLDEQLKDFSGKSRGGQAPKRKPWAERLADELVSLGVSFPKAWATVTEDENDPLALDEDTGVYRSNDGETVVAVDLVAGNELGKQSRSNFGKRYFSLAKKKPGQ